MNVGPENPLKKIIIKKEDVCSKDDHYFITNNGRNNMFFNILLCKMTFFASIIYAVFQSAAIGFDERVGRSRSSISGE